MKKTVFGLWLVLIQCTPTLGQYPPDAPGLRNSFLVHVSTARLRATTAKLKKYGFDVSVVDQCTTIAHRTCRFRGGEALAFVPARPASVPKLEQILQTLPGISGVQTISTTPTAGGLELQIKQPVHLRERDDAGPSRSRRKHRYAATIDVRKTIDIDGMPASARSMVRSYNAGAMLPSTFSTFLKSKLQATDRLAVIMPGPNYFRAHFYVTDKIQNQLEEFFAMKREESISLTIHFFISNGDPRIDIYAIGDGVVTTVIKRSPSGSALFAHHNIGDDQRRGDILRRFIGQLLDDYDDYLSKLTPFP